MHRLHDLGFRYWFVTASFLTAGVAGWHWGYCLAGTLTVVQLLHFSVRTGSLVAFPVQIRIAYLAILFIAAMPGMRWLYWLPLIGTWALVFFGYCLLARTLSLMPWNRTGALTLQRMVYTFTAPPDRANRFHGLTDRATDCASACSLEARFAAGPGAK